MTDNNLVASLQQLDAFADAAKKPLSIETSYKRISFSTGHSLTTMRSFPTCADHSEWTCSPSRLGESETSYYRANWTREFVGLASLLRAEACEEVYAMNHSRQRHPDAVMANCIALKKLQTMVPSNAIPQN